MNDLCYMEEAYIMVICAYYTTGVGACSADLKFNYRETNRLIVRDSMDCSKLTGQYTCLLVMLS